MHLCHIPLCQIAPHAFLRDRTAPDSAEQDELFHAIFAHWNQTIEERLTALDAASGDPGDPDTLNRIIEAFVRPVIRLRHSEEGFYYAQLVGRELAYGSAEADRVLREFFDPLAHRFIEALRTVFQTASLADVAWAYQFALGALLHHLVDDRVHRLSQGQSLAGDPAAADRNRRYRFPPPPIFQGRFLPSAA